MTLVTGWRYDDGEPIYMPAINSYTDARKPCWCCSMHVNSTEGLHQLHLWFEHSYTTDQYDLTYRFNSGNPFVQIKVYDKTITTAFSLSWM